MTPLILIYPLKKTQTDPGTPSQRRWAPLFLLVLIVAFAILYSDFLQTGQDGRPELSPDRRDKLDRELKELENSEQYVLLTARNGEYPCFNCGAHSTINLPKGAVWKYGVTRKGEKGRYGEWHVDNGLVYVVEFEGPLQECLRQEKLKIYLYAVHPENLMREAPLIRPPGNKRDD